MGITRPTGSCQVAAHIILRGRQDTAVRAYSLIDGFQPAYLSLRVGRVLLNIESRRALDDLAGAVGTAVDLADGIFGPPPDRCGPTEPVGVRAPS
jgi:hypothetical protein